MSATAVWLTDDVGPPDQLERENIEFYKKIREGYFLLAESMPDATLWMTHSTKS